ncbi:hypothetical protein AMATHDRAFT_134933 [Amanita thiersii Skay4041]|uniref:Uncharacterized protein n=1 Tax=Amanita thiersii Skay4041 TaxID=703135 RepID=A0A2A9P1T9_9AGAR|nr:hypothetical protein AMATHDRAFT_134933 [Amanita thiersii Skay4041]
MSAAVPTKTINPLLQKYLAQLALHPLRTKALTTAVLCFLQEVLGSNLAGIPARKTTNAPFIVNALTRTHVNLKALKMALYGFLVSAPLSHYLVGLLQRAFSGKQGKGARIAQILAHNLLVSPIQASVYLMSMAIINGRDVVKTVRNGFFPVIRVSWIVSPLSMTIAQNFLPVELWVPFFNAIQFVLGTYFNMRVKQMQLAAAKKEKDSDKEH